MPSCIRTGKLTLEVDEIRVVKNRNKRRGKEGLRTHPFSIFLQIMAFPERKEANKKKRSEKQNKVKDSND